MQIANWKQGERAVADASAGRRGVRKGATQTPKGRAPPVASDRFVREVNRQKVHGAIGHVSETKGGIYAETERNAKEM
jgi:hypothetical protein